MRAVRVAAFGSPEMAQIETVERPEVGEGEVLLKVCAAGVNPVDAKIVAGRLQGRLPHHLPFTPGWDVAGLIVARGHAARRFDEGDPVFGYIRRPAVRDGAWAEYVCVPECYLARKPPSLSFAQAAALPLAGLTAYQGLHDVGRLARGERVLVVGASGGVGGFALQLARVAGALSVAAIARDTNHAYVQSLGAGAVYDYRRADLADAVAADTPEGFDLIFDAVGGDTVHRVAGALREGGRVVTILQHAPMPEGWRYHFVEPNARQLEILGAYAAAGLRVEISRQYRLEDAALALGDITSGHTRGKCVLSLLD
ncbi:MAG: NADP-dependent oxidoreductase [Myxococcales bacterium]|nr:NADP-dependent oxidoreductase [Myxococcales bacterium]